MLHDPSTPLSSSYSMDHPNTKRPRESSFSSASSSPDAIYHQSSPSEIANVKRQHLHHDAQESPPGTLFDFDLSFGVFDFPWLKDGLIYSKSDDWKFEDIFFTSFFNGASTADATPLTIGTAFTELSGQLLWCNLPDPWEEEYEAQTPPPAGGEQAGEGMDCIWRSLLNQPLQQGSSAL